MLRPHDGGRSILAGWSMRAPDHQHGTNPIWSAQAPKTDIGADQRRPPSPVQRAHDTYRASARLVGMCQKLDCPCLRRA
jgi:hypothetical protein